MSVKKEFETQELNNPKEPKKKKQHFMFYKFVSFLTIVLTVISICYIIYLEIISLNILVPAVMGICLMLLIFSVILNKKKLRAWIKNFFVLLCAVLILVDGAVLYYGTNTISFINEITDTGVRVESFGVYVLKDSGYKSINDLKDKEITYLNSEDDTQIRDALARIENKVTIKDNYLDSIEELLDSLINKETDAIFFHSSYEDILRDEFEEKYELIKLLDSVDIVGKVDTLKSNKDITKDPFTVYLSGIDTSGKVSSKARSDVNLLVSVNPSTHQILMISTPRDSYVRLPGKDSNDKLTHAGIYGIEESVSTLEELYGVDVDYYARVNFSSFMSIVTALGGVTVDVPKSFCEQNSKRSKKPEDLICLKKGKRTLNGEQALAYARNRHAFASGDLARGEHQMELLEAIIKKAMSPAILAKYNSLLSAMEGKVSTNISSDEIIKFINKQLKKNTTGWSFASISAKGKIGTGVCYSTGKSRLSIIDLYDTSIEDIKIEIKNLYEGNTDLEEGTSIKSSTTSSLNSN